MNTNKKLFLPIGLATFFASFAVLLFNKAAMNWALTPCFLDFIPQKLDCMFLWGLLTPIGIALSAMTVMLCVSLWIDNPFTSKAKHDKQGFTLLELLVVISIIAILATLIVGKYNSCMESGLSTQCKSHLRNLYQASWNYSADHGGTFPNAGPWESYDQQSQTYSEHPAWVEWTPKDLTKTTSGLWPSGTSSSPHSNDVNQSVWWGDQGRKSITTGTLWEYASQNMKAYVCPKFSSMARSAYSSSDPHHDVVRSYVMNSCFGCNDKQTSINLSSLVAEASRTMMFSDMQRSGTYQGNSQLTVCSQWAGNGTDDGDDGVLTATVPPVALACHESIGFIHPMAGGYLGHAVFLDGHIEAIGLQQPDGTLSNRTTDACNGTY